MPAIGGGLFPHGFISYYNILPGAWLVSTNLARKASLFPRIYFLLLQQKLSELEFVEFFWRKMFFTYSQSVWY